MRGESDILSWLHTQIPRLLPPPPTPRTINGWSLSLILFCLIFVELCDFEMPIEKKILKKKIRRQTSPSDNHFNNSYCLFCIIV